MVKRIAVLGSPISHSKSPVIQAAALSHLGFESVIEKIDVASNLSKWLRENGENWDAFAVTMPLKEEAHEIATSLDEASIATGSTNFLLRTQLGYLGFNTDVIGIREATKTVRRESIGIIGTGATARSALFALGGEKLKVWGRDQAKAEGLAKSSSAISSTLDDVAACDLVISTLPKGILPSLLAGDKPGVIMDAVYAQPLSTNFSRHISGLEMLIWQAIGQLRVMINSGQPFPDEDLIHELMQDAAKVGE